MARRGPPIATRGVVNWEFGWNSDTQKRHYMFARLVVGRKKLYTIKRTVTDKTTMDKVQHEVLNFMEAKNVEFYNKISEIF